MKLATTFAVVTAAAVGVASAIALAQGSNIPPVPKPAAGALPQTATKAEVRSARAQTAEEQKSSAQSTPVSPGSSRRGSK